MRKRKGFAGAVLGLALILLATGTPVMAAKFGKISDEEWQASPPADYPEATAIILSDVGHMAVTPSVIEFERHVRIKILTDAGIDEVGEQSFWYHDEYDRVKGFKAHTFTPDGKKHKVKKDAIFVKVSGDYRKKVFTFPQLTEGCIIEYKYTIYSENFRYLDPWYFQSDIYTLHSAISVALSDGFVYNVAYHNIPVQTRTPITVETRDLDRGGEYKIRTFTWTMTDLPPITDEPYMAAEENYRSNLKFQIVKYEDRYNNIVYVKGWKELGERYQKRLDDYNNKRKDIRKLVEQITEGLTTPIEKSKALFAYVVQNFATSTDYSNWLFVHEKISTMLEEKRGSEEERNYLLACLHQEAGVEAWPLLISTRDNGLINPQNPSLQPFNHLICYVQFDNSYILLDAQYEKAPYGLLTPRCLVDMGFLIDEDRYPLIKLEALPTTSYRADVTKMVIDSDGVAACSSQCRFSGYWATMYGRRYDQKEPEEFAEEYFIDRLPSECNLGSHNCILDTTSEFVATIDFTAQDLVVALDNNLLIKPVSYAYRQNPFKSEKRFFPVDFMYPFTYHNITEIILLDSAIEYQPVPDLSFEISGASFVRQTEITDSSLIVGSKMVIEKALFAPSAYNHLRGFFDKVAQCSEDEVAVVLSPGKK